MPICPVFGLVSRICPNIDKLHYFTIRILILTCWSLYNVYTKQAGWFLRLDCTPGPNAPSSECWPNVVPNSEFRTCADPEFPNVLHSEFMNTPNVEFLNVPVCSMPMSYLASSKWVRPLCYGHAAAHWCFQRSTDGSIELDRGVASVLALWR